MRKTIVILGASSDRSKFGNKAVRAYHNKGYEVYPVNPKGGEIEGLTAYPSISDLPEGKIDRVSVYLPPAIGINLLDDIAERGCDELWLNPGSESDELVEQAKSKGLNPVVACSILDVGESPANYQA